MSFELFLAVNIMSISALGVVFGLLYRPDGYAAGVVANLAVLAAGGLALWLDWSLPGALVTLIFLTFVVGPLVLMRLAQQRAVAGFRPQAARYARWAAILAPTASARLTAGLYEAQARPDPDSVVAGLRELARRCDPAQAPLVEALALRIQGDHAGVLDILRRQPASVPLFFPLKIRALGETGALDEMVRLCASLPLGLPQLQRDECRLMALVFCGQMAGVDTLLSTRLSMMPQDTKRYWLAMAQLSSTGVNEETRTQARTILRALASSAPDRLLRRAAGRRLTEPSRADATAALAPKSLALLHAIEHEATAPRPPRQSSLTLTPVTLGLIAINALAFALELWRNASEDGEGLLAMGALYPPAVLEDSQWWRLLTAMFLHLGWLHILSNMFVLFAFARTLEPALGSVRFLICYLVGGLASSAGVLALMSWHVVDEGYLVGASGAIFALFGVMFAFALSRWLRTRQDVDQRELVNLIVIALVQSAIDLSVPQISFSAHGVGFLAGLGMGLVLANSSVLGRSGRSQQG